jgi:hypothetical protein
MFKVQNILFALFAVLLLGCDRDKLETKPKIKIVKYDPDTQVLNDPGNANGFGYKIELEFGDKQGDTNDTLWIKKVRRSRIPRNGISSSIFDSLRVGLPEEFPGTRRGNIIYTFDYTQIFDDSFRSQSPANKQRDTFYFRFMLKDRDGNTSDTINSRDIILDTL